MMTRYILCHILINGIPAGSWSNDHWRETTYIAANWDRKIDAEKVVQRFKKRYKQRYNLTYKEYKIQVALGLIPYIEIREGKYIPRHQPI